MHLKNKFGLMIITFLFACGPMNEKNKIDNKEPSIQYYSSHVGLTKSKTYYVSSKLNEWSDPKPFETNVYVFRIVSYTDLSPLPQNAVIKIYYRMPEHPTMGIEETVGKRESDGSYTGKIEYSMGGAWEIKIKIMIGDVTDEIVFNADVKDNS